MEPTKEIPLNPPGKAPERKSRQVGTVSPSKIEEALAPVQAPVKRRFFSGKRLLIIPVAIAALIFLSHFLYVMFTTESTDDAFIAAHVHIITNQVQGTVAQVLVEDNQSVKKGDILVRLDPRDYAAQAKIAQAKYAKAHKDLRRIVGGEGSDEAPLPDVKPILDDYTANALSSDADLQRAMLNWEHTNVVAPADGKIGKRSVETGQLLQPGQSLMALVEPHPWVVANFKEGQIAHIRVGQKVTVSVDAVPDKNFTGKVDSISPGSGATFSLLPPDNATGNFTKIVQRIAVKIVFDEDSIKGYEARLVPGMSTEVTIQMH